MVWHDSERDRVNIFQSLQNQQQYKFTVYHSLSDKASGEELTATK